MIEFMKEFCIWFGLVVSAICFIVFFIYVIVKLIKK